MEKTKISALPNGPLMIEGNLIVTNSLGETIKESEKVFLCRCGQSANKPFCDGSHKKINFKTE